jgi:hypothetical protein
MTIVTLIGSIRRDTDQIPNHDSRGVVSAGRNTAAAEIISTDRLQSTRHVQGTNVPAVRRGDRKALDRLTPLVYEHLRKLARHYVRKERPDGQMNATTLVNEAYVRLVDARAGTRGPLARDPRLAAI